MFEEVFAGTSNLVNGEDYCTCICRCTGEIRIEIKIDDAVWVA